MNISDWLDKKEAEGIDVSHIVLPDNLANEEAPEETIFFQEIRSCSILCTGTGQASVPIRPLARSQRPVFLVNSRLGLLS